MIKKVKNIIFFILLAGTLWSDKLSAALEEVYHIDLNIYDGIGSLLLHWSVPDEIEIKDYFAVDPNNVSKSLYFKAVDAWKNKFFIIPNEFWRDTYFRGEQMSEDYYKFNHKEPIYGYSSQTDVLLILNSLVGTKWKLRLVEGILKKRLISFRLFKLKFKYFLIPSLKFKFLKLFKSEK